MDPATTFRWLAEQPGVSPAVKKQYLASADHLEDTAALTDRLETRVATLLAKVVKLEGDLEQAEAAATEKVRRQVLESLGLPIPAPGVASPAQAQVAPSYAWGAAAVPLGLEFYQTGCTNKSPSCTCVADRKTGKCTGASFAKNMGSNPRLDLLWVQVVGASAKYDYPLREWASKHGSKKHVGSCSAEIPAEHRQQVKAVRAEVMEHLHRAFEEVSSEGSWVGTTAMRRFWAQHKDPKYEYVRIFKEIASDASTAMAELEKAIPLDAEGAYLGGYGASVRPTKRGKFK